MSQDEREIRAFEAIIVSQLHRERDPMNLNDLPELTEGQKAALKGRPNDFVEKLWAEVENEKEEDEECDDDVCDVEAVEEEFAAMNRAEEMDDETRKALDEARKEVVESMRKQNKEHGGANG
jgi:hypothetical protein